MRVDELVSALRSREALRARVLYAELLSNELASAEPPSPADAIDMAIAASILELAAARSNKTAPAWTRSVGPLSAPYLLVTAKLPAKLMRLQRESPPELRGRNLIAPANFLLSA